jgi:hypothetical protein
VGNQWRGTEAKLTQVQYVVSGEKGKVNGRALTLKLGRLLCESVMDCLALWIWCHVPGGLGNT